MLSREGRSWAFRFGDHSAAASEGLGDVARTANWQLPPRPAGGRPRRGFQDYNITEFKITGPCSSRVLWSLARMELIADPPGGPLQGCHSMVLTAKGAAALRATTQNAEPEIDQPTDHGSLCRGKRK